MLDIGRLRQKPFDWLRQHLVSAGQKPEMPIKLRDNLTIQFLAIIDAHIPVIV